jgi:hypothetical protein
LLLKRILKGVEALPFKRLTDTLGEASMVLLLPNEYMTVVLAGFNAGDMLSTERFTLSVKFEEIRFTIFVSESVKGPPTNLTFISSEEPPVKETRGVNTLHAIGFDAPFTQDSVHVG